MIKKTIRSVKWNEIDDTITFTWVYFIFGIKIWTKTVRTNND